MVMVKVNAIDVGVAVFEWEMRPLNSSLTQGVGLPSEMCVKEVRE